VIRIFNAFVDINTLNVWIHASLQRILKNSTSTQYSNHIANIYYVQIFSNVIEHVNSKLQLFIYCVRKYLIKKSTHEASV